MTGPTLLGGPAFSRGVRWASAIAIAILLLVAAEMRTAPGLGGARAARDVVRVLVGALCLAGALLALRWDARSEAAGFLVAGLAVLLTAGMDAATHRWAVADVQRRVLAGRVAVAVVALGGGVLLGMKLLKVSILDLTRAPPRWPRTFALAFGLGLATYPLLALANVYGNVAVDRVLALGTPAWTAPWPGIEDVVLRREPFPEWSSFAFTGIALQLVLVLPLTELLLHGVLRQAFGRWGAIPFVVGTAFLVPFLLMQQHMSFAGFGGAIVTGVFAARTASVLPALAYWTAVFMVQAVTFAAR